MHAFWSDTWNMLFGPTPGTCSLVRHMEHVNALIHAPSVRGGPDTQTMFLPHHLERVVWYDTQKMFFGPTHRTCQRTNPWPLPAESQDTQNMFWGPAPAT